MAMSMVQLNVTNKDDKVTLRELREALEASWDAATSYGGVSEGGNPALGQCYPTAWVVQQFYPEVEIVEGEVWTGKSLEKHFWNVRISEAGECHIDLTWQQFPAGSVMRGFKIRNREKLGDSPATIKRCGLLRDRVARYLERRPYRPQPSAATEVLQIKQVFGERGESAESFGSHTRLPIQGGLFGPPYEGTLD
jgi:hypothetical protein